MNTTYWIDLWAMIQVFRWTFVTALIVIVMAMLAYANWRDRK